MPALQVRDFPEELYEQLRAYAAANHRSIAQQTIIAVEQMLRGASSTEQELSGDNEPEIYDFETEKKRRALIAKKRALLEEIHRMNEEHPIQMSSAEMQQILKDSRYELEHRHDYLLPGFDAKEDTE